MGIKCLLKLNEELGLIKKIKLENYKYKKIAIDISILIYRIVISVRNSGADFTNKKGDITSHILGLFNKTMDMLKNGILPIYVFDGKPPSIKNKTIEERKNIRKKALEKFENAENEEDKIKYFKRSACITKIQFEQCMDLLTLMGIPYIIAPEEADSQCAYLAKMGLVDAVMTEDMDILTFGSPKIVRNLTSHKIEATEICLNEVLERLEINQEQFIEFCILLGSDYCNGITEVKPQIILEYFKKSKNIKDTISNMKEDGLKVPSKIFYEETKEYFLNPIIEKEVDLKFKKPQYSKLLKKLVNDYGLIKYLIKNKLDKLNKIYEEIMDL